MPPASHPSDDFPVQSETVGRAHRWVDVQVPSIAAVTVVLSAAAQQSVTPVRLGGPITSLVLASLIDTPRGDLAAAGITAWVETDRRDDRRDGWTTDRIGLEGRWLLFDQRAGTVATGSSAHGLPGPAHPLWRDLSVRTRPADLDVQAWQRVDRTAWVLHDGDGEVFAELVIDEQRRMGTHEASVEARLVSRSEHTVFEALVGPLHACFGMAERHTPAAGRTLTELQDAQWERTVGDTARSIEAAPADPVPGEQLIGQASGELGSDSTLGMPSGPDGDPDTASPPRAGRRLARQPRDTATLDDLSWVIAAAVDVDSAARTGRPPTKAFLRSAAGLVGVAPALRALNPGAAAYLDAMMPDLVSAELALVRCADDAWALRRLTRNVGSTRTHLFDPLQWNAVLSPLTPGSSALGRQSVTVRSMVLAMLEQSEPAGSAVPNGPDGLFRLGFDSDSSVYSSAAPSLAILTHSLAHSVEAWITAHGNLRKPLDARRTAALRASVSAYRLASDAAFAPDSSQAQGRLARVVDLDRELRSARRRFAMLALIDRAASLPLQSLGPIEWMRIGVFANEVRNDAPHRLAFARRRARRLQRDLNRSR